MVLSELHTLPIDALNRSPDKKQHNVRVTLFRQVQNATQLQELLATGELDCALVRPQLMVDMFHVLAACCRAVACFDANKMCTRNVHTEIVYSMSPSKNISESLSVFGAKADSVDVLAIVHDDKSGSKMDKVAKLIDAKSVPLDELKLTRDYDAIKKVYHVRSPDTAGMNLEDAIVTRIVSKDCI